MTPPPAGTLAAPSRPVGMSLPTLAAPRPRTPARAGRTARGYDSPVAMPVALMHEEQETPLDAGLDDSADLDPHAGLPVRLEIPGGDEDPSDVPASADDLVAPGARVTLFEQAVEQNSRRLLAIARAIVGYRASPEDVVQQAIMNLYKHRARYDWRKPGGLLKRAVVNEALRLLRPPRMSMVADDHPASFRAPSSDMETSETVRKVREAIDQLPEHFRAALVLCEYEGMSYAQIAETLDASIPQIKTWLHRARRKLATMLEPFVAEQQAGQ